jgi:hypothetical protein
MEFDCDIALEAFDTPEVAINPVALAKSLRECVHSDCRIEVRLAHHVVSIEDVRARTLRAGTGRIYPKKRDGWPREHLISSVACLLQSENLPMKDGDSSKLLLSGF